MVDFCFLFLIFAVASESNGCIFINFIYYRNEEEKFIDDSLRSASYY